MHGRRERAVSLMATQFMIEQQLQERKDQQKDDFLARLARVENHRPTTMKLANAASSSLQVQNPQLTTHDDHLLRRKSMAQASRQQQQAQKRQLQHNPQATPPRVQQQRRLDTVDGGQVAAISETTSSFHSGVDDRPATVQREALAREKELQRQVSERIRQRRAAEAEHLARLHSPSFALLQLRHKAAMSGSPASTAAGQNRHI